MTDISKMNMEVDTSDVAQAKRAVDSFADSTKKAAASAALLGKQFDNESLRSTRQLMQSRSNLNKQRIREEKSVAAEAAKSDREQQRSVQALAGFRTRINNQRIREEKAAATAAARAEAQVQQQSAKVAQFRSRMIAQRQREEQASANAAVAMEEERRRASQRVAEFRSRMIAQRQREEQAASRAAIAAMEEERRQAQRVAEFRSRMIAQRQREEQASATRVQQFRSRMIAQRQREENAVAAAAIAAQAKMEAETRRLNRAYTQFGRTVHDTGRRGVQSLGDMLHLASGLRGTMLSLAGIMSGFGLYGLYNLLDQYTLLINNMQILGYEGTRARDRLREIADVARYTRQPVDELSAIYKKAQMAAGELGASSADVLQFTENVGLAMAQVGSAGQAARGALLQLSQAIGTGLVRAEEFNSMMEGAYPVLQAAARGIDEAGGSVMRLRMMMLDQRLTSKMFFDAILSQSQELADIFDKTIPTMSQAMVVFRDSLTLSIGEIDKALGFSESLARGILRLSSTILDWTRDNQALIQGIRTFGHTLVAAAVILSGRFLVGLISAKVEMIAIRLAAANAVGTMYAFGVATAYVNRALATFKLGAVILLLGTMSERMSTVNRETKSWGTTFELMGGMFMDVIDDMVDGAKMIVYGISAPLWEVSAIFEDVFGSITEVVATGINTAIGIVIGGVNAMGAAFKNFGPLALEALRGGARMVIGGITSIMNAGIRAVNSIGGDFEELNIDNFMPDMLKTSNAARDAGADVKAAFQEGFNRQTIDIGDVTKTFREGAMVARDNAIIAADAAKQHYQGMRQAGDATLKWKEHLESSKKTADDTNKSTEELVDHTNDLGDAAEKGGKKGSKAAKDTKDEVDKLNEALRNELESAVDGVADAFGRWVSRGLTDFKDFAGDVIRTFQNMLAQMVAMAAKNRIMIGLGIDPLSGALAAAGAPIGAATGPGGVVAGAGLLGSMKKALGGFGNAGSIFGIGGLGGGTGFLGGFGNAISGGLSGMFSIGSNIAAAGGGLAATLGAIAPPLAAVAAVFSFFSKKTKELDRGMRLTVDGFDTLVQTFNTIQTKRFWGLSKKTRTHYQQADAETQDMLSSIVAQLQQTAMGYAAVLGFGADTFKDFMYKMSLSTKDMTEEQALKAIQDELGKVGDAFADMIPNLHKFTKAGETSTAALERLATSLITVDQIMDTLGHRLNIVGIKGADVASSFADLFGGLEAMTSATQTYYEAFYSEEERVATTLRQTTAALRELGLTMPQTRKEYRNMIDSLDLNTVKGRETYAALVSLASAFDMILPAIGELTKELQELLDVFTSSLDNSISSLRDAVQYQQDLSNGWKTVTTGLRSFITELRGTATELTSPLEALRNNTRQYRRLLRQANNGNLESAQGLTQAAQSMLESVRNAAQTSQEVAIAEARVLSELGGVADRGDVLASRHEIIAGYMEKQIELLTEMRDFLSGGGELTEEMLQNLKGSLNEYTKMISDAQKVNYNNLKELFTDKNGLFNFDPKKVFAGWDDILGVEKIRQPMVNMRSSMSNLRLSINDLIDEMRAARRNEEKRNNVAALDKYVSGLQANAAGNHFVDDQDLKTMSRIIGLDTKNLTTTQIRNRLKNYDDGDLLKGTIYDPTGDREQAYLDRVNAKNKPKNPKQEKQYTLDDYRILTMRQGSERDNSDRLISIIFGPLGGSKTFDNGTYGKNFDRQSAVDWLTENQFPAFASGGIHTGGPRIVGETGIEIENTGPSRIYNTRQTSEIISGDIVIELKELRREVESLRKDNNAANSENIRQNKRSADLARKWDMDGLPAERN